VQPLSDYLASLPGRDNPNAFIFPLSASAKRTASLSNQFHEILSDAGLVEPRTHQSTGKGRSQARETSEISFHSLRHSAVTMLKASGLSDVFAREIVGHETAAVSRHYTHLTIRPRSFVRLRLGQSARSTVITCAFNRLLDFSDYGPPATKLQDTRLRKSA
jgi:integrase